MGVFSKIKEIFEKKTIESFKQFEVELLKMRDKNKYDLIALIGISGRVKGLPLIYATDDEVSLKLYSAKINEILEVSKNLPNEKVIREIIINYSDSILYFSPIMSNIGLFAIIGNQSYIIVLRQFIYNNQKLLKELFHENS